MNQHRKIRNKVECETRYNYHGAFCDKHFEKFSEKSNAATFRHIYANTAFNLKSELK